MHPLPVFNFEQLNLEIDSGKPGLLSGNPTCYRAKVPGGWIVALWWTQQCSTVFYADPDHEWDGGTLD